jgi:hypothetical protein
MDKKEILSTKPVNLMTLHEYYTGLIFQALLSNPETFDGTGQGGIISSRNERTAVVLAHQLIKELIKDKDDRNG